MHRKKGKIKKEGKESYFSHSSSFNPDQGIGIKLQKYVFASVLSLLPRGSITGRRIVYFKSNAANPPIFDWKKKKKWQGKEENKELESNILNFPLHMISQALRATFVPVFHVQA